jgi:phosphoribosylformylglycinamidine synthase
MTTPAEQALRARVRVMPKRSVLDPQGRAVGDTLKALGLNDIGDVRVGRVIEIDIDALDDVESIRDELNHLCETFLANPVVEEWEIDL